MKEQNPQELLIQLEDILDSDPLIDEVGFIHPSQFVTLDEEAADSLFSSSGNLLQSECGPRVSKVNPSETVYWCRDHKLGISTQVLFPLYNAAKSTFMAALERYKIHSSKSGKNYESGSDNMSNCHLASLDTLESEVMKHSKALLLLSCDFGTAWNSRKVILSNKQHLQMFVDELSLSALVLSYAPKSERSWSHRRWVIQLIAGKCSNLQEIVERESELVRQLAEKSKMNYRAWYHRCWLVSYMSGGQVLIELSKSRDWSGLHIADSSCFHYRTRLMLRMLEESCDKQHPIASSIYHSEIRQVWKEELDWNEKLIRCYKGREALWLHRRFLSLGWVKHFLSDIRDASRHSAHKYTMNQETSMFIDTELELLRSCSTIPDNDFEDFQAHAMFSAAYVMWLTKQISGFLDIELENKLPAEELKALLNKVCPEKNFLWNSFHGIRESL